MSGDEVRLDGEVFGDAVLFGSSVDIAAPVHGDGVIAGRELQLVGPFLADLYAAGARVVIDGTVQGNARMAGGEVTLGPQSAIAGGVSIGAGRAVIAGSVGRYLQIGASSTTLSGHVAGDVEVSGDELYVGPSARIGGRLVFRGPRPADVAPGARVDGGISNERTGDSTGPRHWLFGLALWSAIGGLGMAIVGAFAWVFWPRFTGSAVEAAARRGGAALLAGLAVALGGPLAIALLSLSVVGLPLALIASCLYVMAYPLGYLTAAASISERLHERIGFGRLAGTGRRVLALLAALLLLCMLAVVPVVGPLSLAALTLLGMGALALASLDAYRNHETSAVLQCSTSGSSKARDGSASILM